LRIRDRPFARIRVSSGARCDICGVVSLRHDARWILHALRASAWAAAWIAWARLWSSLGGWTDERMRWAVDAAGWSMPALGWLYGTVRGPRDDARRPTTRLDVYLPLGGTLILAGWLAPSGFADAVTVSAGAGLAFCAGRDVARVCAPRMDAALKRRGATRPNRSRVPSVAPCSRATPTPRRPPGSPNTRARRDPYDSASSG